MGLADLFSGGKNKEAADVLKQQLEKLNGLQTPTAEQLTLPELTKYVQAGILTPEQAKSYGVDDNAFDKLTADNAGLDTELSTIGKLKDIVNQGGNDAEEQSNVQRILNTLSTTESGDNAAIVADNARRGVGNSGLTMAAKLAAEQNGATNANSTALDAAANAEARQMAALSAEGTLGGQVQGQQYGAGANRASAANAIAEFNAQQKQDISKLNTTETNAAKAANLGNAQEIANKNTGVSQEQERDIPAAREKAYQDALGKASAGMSGARDVANEYSKQGEENAGELGGLISTAGQLGASYLTGNPYMALATLAPKGNTPNTNINTDPKTPDIWASGGGRISEGGIEKPMNMMEGGPVPGKALVPGDSPTNDTQMAVLSPGEIVLPRSVSAPAMSGDASKVLEFLKSLPRPEKSSVHPRAVLDTLHALNLHHSGVA